MIGKAFLMRRGWKEIIEMFIIGLMAMLLTKFSAFAQELVWEPTNGPYGGQIKTLLVTPDGTLYAGTYNNGVFRSKDKGDNWTEVNTGLQEREVFSLAVMGPTLFASTISGVFRSDNEGNSWFQTGQKRSTSSLAVMGATLFAGTGGGVGGGGIYSSDDGGNTWLNKGLDLENKENKWIFSFAIMDTTIYAGTRDDGVFRSNDKGISWTKVNTGLTDPFISSLAVMGATLYAGTWEKGVFRSNDSGNSWTQINKGLSAGIVYSLTVMSATLFAGTNGGVFRSEDGGNSWMQVNRGLTGLSVLSFAVMGATLFAGTLNGVFRSEDRGNNWTEVNKGLAATDVLCLAAMEATLFAGTWGDDVFRSEDGGNSWMQVNRGLTRPNVFSLAVMGTTLFAGVYTAVFRSEDKGNTWFMLEIEGDPSISIISFVVMGTTLYAGGTGGIYRSEDKGKNWVKVMTVKPDLSVNSLAVMGATLFAGTKEGVFRSDDKGQSWTAVNAGLGSESRWISSLAVMGATLFAGTDAGVFRSEDRGNTWFYTGLSQSIRYFAISGTRLYAGVGSPPGYDLRRRGGVFQSNDKGDTWIHNGLENYDLTSLAIMGATLFAGTGRSGRIFRASLSDVSSVPSAPSVPSVSSVPLAPSIVSTIAATSPIIADGISNSIITITVKDSTGKPIPNKTITISVTGSNNIISQPSAPTDQNGITTAKLRSTKAETKTVSITVDGTPMFTTAKVEFLPDIVSTATSTIIAGESAMADGISQIKLTIKLLDANKNPIKDKKALLSVSGTGNIIVQPEKPTNESGETIAFISSTKAEDKTITATVAVDEVKLKPIVVAFTPPPQPKLVIRATSPHIADGEDTSTIILVLTDAKDNPMPNKGLTVLATGTGNIIFQPTSATDAAGRTTAKLKSTNPETKTITATYEFEGQKVQATTPVEFQPSAKPVSPPAPAPTPALTQPSQEEPKMGFSINALNPTQSAEVGKSALYLINLVSKGGYKSDLTLRISDPPKGVEAEFNPKVVNISAENPSNNSQLTIRVGNDTPVGEHKFTVSAVAADKSAKEIELMLQVKALAKTDSFIFIEVEPTQPRLGDKLKVKGSVISPEGELKVKIPMTINYKPSEGNEITQSLQTDESGRYSAEIEVKQKGKWELVVSWAGDKSYKAAQKSKAIEALKGMSQIAWQQALQMEKSIGDKISLIAQLKPELEKQTIKVQIIKPNGISTVDNIITQQNGIFKVDLELNTEGIWKLVASWEGNESYEKTVSAETQIIAATEAPKVIIVLGGGSERDNPAWNKFAGLANHVYKILKNRKLSDDDIYYLSPTLKTTEAIDRPTSESALEFAITQWAKQRVGAHVPLFIYLLSHNLNDKFILEKRGDYEVTLTPEKLNGWLDVLPKGTEVTIIIEACYSGNFIRKKGEGGETPVLSKPGRVIITSADNNRQAIIEGVSLLSFTRIFFDEISRNRDVKTAFLNTREALRASRSLQSPQLDANGDGVSNDPSRDFPAVGSKYVPTDIQLLPSVPEIQSVSKPQQLKADEKSATIKVRLTGVDILKVIGTLIPPNYNPDREIKDWNDVDFETIKFERKEEGLYEGRYDNFSQVGTYTIVVNAENPDGSAIPVETTVTVLSPPWDLNSDGEVNIFDIVTVAKNMGQAVKEGDINLDGKVDIFDLVLVASHFGEKSSASPSAEIAPMDYSHSQYLPLLEKAYQLLQSSYSDNPSPDLEKAKKLLEHLISLAKPMVKETKLLANYPNPFNPETWIPYQLSKASEVSITIYDVLGRVVKQLNLGYQQAGMYRTKNRAAHWDGRNELGEFVASGVYFVELKTEKYRQVRRIVLLK